MLLTFPSTYLVRSYPCPLQALHQGNLILWVAFLPVAGGVETG